MQTWVHELWISCGMSGSCTSYWIVDDVVFEWQGVAVLNPLWVVTLCSKVVGGYGCTDGNGADGFGAAPCYEVIVWDEERGTFWSSNGDLKFVQTYLPHERRRWQPVRF